MQNIAAVRPPGAAKLTGLSTSTLAKMRLRGDGPAYVKLGPRAVAYRIVDLDEWLTAHRRRSTCESKLVRSSPSDAERGKGLVAKNGEQVVMRHITSGTAKSAECLRKSPPKKRGAR